MPMRPEVLRVLDSAGEYRERSAAFEAGGGEA